MAKNNLVGLTTKDGKKEVKVTIEKISNGYLLVETTEWEDSKKGWQYESKKTYHKDNPLKNVKI